MGTRRKLVLITSVLVGVIIVVVAAIAAYATYLKRTTDDLRGDLARLMRTQASYADLKTLELKYARFRTPFRFSIGTAEKDFAIDPSVCTRQECGVAFSIDNGLLAKLALVKPSRFSSTIVVLNDRVAYLEMSLFGGPNGFNGGIVEFIPCCTEISKLIGTSDPYSFPTPIGKPYLRVRMTDRATSDEVGRAAALDTRCFLSHSGCDWPCHYLPLAWSDYAKQLPSGEIEYWQRKGMKCAENR